MKEKSLKTENNSKNTPQKTVQQPLPGSRFSKDECVEIYAEAYYRAMKRLQEEKNAPLGETAPKSKKGKWKRLGSVIKWIILPVNPKGIGGDELLRILCGELFSNVGIILYVVGLVLLYFFIADFWRNQFSISTKVFAAIMGIVALLISALFRAAGRDIESEKDSNRLYAYTASLAAVLSLVVAVISFLWQQT